MVVPFDYALQTIIKINSRNCKVFKCTCISNEKETEIRQKMTENIHVKLKAIFCPLTSFCCFFNMCQQ